MAIVVMAMFGGAAFGQESPTHATEPSLQPQEQERIERGRFNLPHPKHEVELRTGNFTNHSAIDIMGITNQFYVLAGVVFQPDHVCVTDYPFRAASNRNRTQMLFMASELGPAPKTINIIEIARKMTGTSNVQNFTVRLMHTNLASFNAQNNFVNMAGAQTVFNRTPYVIPAGSGACGSPPDNQFTWITLNLDSHFEYNGTDNLIVEIDWGPRNSGDTSRQVLAGTYPEARVLVGWGGGSPTYRRRDNTRPNIRFGYQIPTFGTVEEMVNNFVTGCVNVSNISFSGNHRQIGFFQRRPGNTNSDFPFQSGIVISTGQIVDAAGPNNSDSRTTQFDIDDGFVSRDPDIAIVAGVNLNQTFDAANLTFDFVPNSETVIFRYIFASEEYPEWACSGYNDAFGFFISGPTMAGGYSNGAINVAQLPGGLGPVTINNIRENGYDLLAANAACRLPNSNCCPDENTDFFVQLPPGSTSIEYDGRTVVLTAVLTGLHECATYRFKASVADVLDSKWDSGVFLEAGSFGAEHNVGFENINFQGVGSDIIFRGCNPNTMRIQRPQDGDLSDPLDVSITVGGTAIFGVHHSLTSQTVTIPAGEWYVDIPYILLDNPIPGGMATIILSTPQGCPCDGAYSSITLRFYDTYDFQSIIPTPATSCAVPNGAIAVSLSLPPTSPTFNFYYVLKDAFGSTIAMHETSSSNHTFTGLASGTYIVEVFDDASCNFISQTVVVNAPGLPVVTCPANITLCLNDSPITLSGATPAGGTYSGPGVNSGSGQFDPMAAGAGLHTISYVYTDPVTNCTNNCFFTILVNALPVVTCPENIVDVCLNDSPITLAGATPAGGTYSGTGVNESTGVFDPDLAGPGTHTITYTYTDPGTGCTNTCQFTIEVNPAIPPSFSVPSPFLFCVLDIFSAIWDGLPEPLTDIIPDPWSIGEPRRPDWYIIVPGSTELDIDLTDLTLDDCCEEDHFTLQWRIDFEDGTSIPANPGDFISGQPSEYGTHIVLPGDENHTVNLIHTITYSVVDCLGETTTALPVDITITPRPNLMKVYE